MLIKNLSKRERNIAILTVSVVALALIYSFVLEPLVTRWRMLNSEIESRMGALEKDSKILAGQKRLESEYVKYSKYARSQRSDEQAAADLLTYVETLARNDSCLLVNIKPVGVKNIGSYKEILIDITAEGNIEQFSKFLYDIENPRNILLNVERFTLTSKSQSGALRGSILISKILIE